MSTVKKSGTAAEHDADKVEGARTTDQLRAEIDAGKAGDKHAHNDPAAAPLGADAEAGGPGTAREALETARKNEIRKP